MEENTLCNEGLVKEILPDGLIVETMQCSACGSCHAKSVCIAGEQKEELLKITVNDPQSFEIGEKVNIYMEKSLAGKAVILAYLLPFIILFSTLFITTKLTGNELLAFCVTIFTTAIYYLLLWLLNKKQIVDRQFVVKARKCCGI
ncbi:MAG: SoxR reducing system RseC family protein [Bacteroidales bacterium]|jgi:sigma-E factor negative regulatory protein RseC|nr:SoxR reducing system RseC family protein [Bacteroidales bacterium]